MTSSLRSSDSEGVQNNLAALKLDRWRRALPDYMRTVSGAMELSGIGRNDDRRGQAKKQRVFVRRSTACSASCRIPVRLDWSFQASVSVAEDRGAATLRFIDEAENVLLVGSPGVGKDVIQGRAWRRGGQAGAEVRFMDCGRLVDD